MSEMEKSKNSHGGFPMMKGPENRAAGVASERGGKLGDKGGLESTEQSGLGRKR